MGAGAGPLLLLLLLAGAGAGKGTSSKGSKGKPGKGSAAPSVVHLKKGHAYRFGLRLLKSSVPLSPELIQGIAQGITKSGGTRLEFSAGPPPTVEYDQTAATDHDITLHKVQKQDIGTAHFEFEFYKANELTDLTS